MEEARILPTPSRDQYHFRRSWSFPCSSGPLSFKSGHGCFCSVIYANFDIFETVLYVLTVDPDVFDGFVSAFFNPFRSCVAPWIFLPKFCQVVGLSMDQRCLFFFKSFYPKTDRSFNLYLKVVTFSFFLRLEMWDKYEDILSYTLYTSC